MRTYGSPTSNTFSIGLGADYYLVCVKGNFVDEQGNRTELVEILCVYSVRGLTELKLIHVVVGDVQLEEFEVRSRVKMEGVL
jgi:hypothetical protein